MIAVACDVASKSERRAALDRVAPYHEDSLSLLVQYVAVAIDRFRAGEMTATEVDAMVHCYHRAARKLWKFCWASGGTAHTDFVAPEIDHQLAEGQQTDWWQRSERRSR